ncbi:uncharacterized protein A4U43_C08F18740 [Asparagus officinalis]|nr:uncharacterized protein A4U43_C08F18740 [Asparagus officinalis]
MRAHRLIERVQKEQRTVYYGIKKPKPLIVITPTYVRTFQAMYLTGLMHSLMLVPFDFTWLVVEAGGVSNETASILDRSHLNYVHVPFDEGKKMPMEWGERRKMEARMRLHALRVVREKKMDGIVVFADDSNIHSTEMFDEIQKVKHIGAISVGFLTHSDIEEENHSIPIQGPECTPSGKFVGMQTLDPSSNKLEWAGFVLSSRLLWENVEERPTWVQNIDDLEIESPLALLKDASYVEPLGNCGKKILVWWIRSEARADSKFPAGWVIDSPSKSPLPSGHSSSTSDYLTRLRHDKMNNTNKEHMERHLDDSYIEYLLRPPSASPRMFNGLCHPWSQASEVVTWATNPS